MARNIIAIVLVAAAAIAGMTGAYVLRTAVGGASAPASTSAQFVNGAAQGDSLQRHGTQYNGGAEIGPAAPRDPSDQRGGPKA